MQVSRHWRLNQQRLGWSARPATPVESNYFPPATFA